MHKKLVFISKKGKLDLRTSKYEIIRQILRLSDRLERVSSSFKKEVETPQCHRQLGQMLRPANICEQKQGRCNN